jgi:hypothetical protein
MKLETFSKNEGLIKLSREEVVIISNALNEVCNALDLDEFYTRIGADLVDVKNLLREFNGAHEVMQSEA